MCERGRNGETHGANNVDRGIERVFQIKLLRKLLYLIGGDGRHTSRRSGKRYTVTVGWRDDRKDRSCKILV